MKSSFQSIGLATVMLASLNELTTSFAAEAPQNSSAVRLLTKTDGEGLLHQDGKVRVSSASLLGQLASAEEIATLLKEVNGGKGKACHGMYFLGVAMAAAECGVQHPKDTQGVREMYTPLIAGLEGAATKLTISTNPVLRVPFPKKEDVTNRQNFLAQQAVAATIIRWAQAGAVEPFKDVVIKDLTAISQKPWADATSKQALANAIGSVLIYTPPATALSKIQ